MFHFKSVLIDASSELMICFEKINFTKFWKQKSPKCVAVLIVVYMSEC